MSVQTEKPTPEDSHVCSSIEDPTANKSEEINDAPFNLDTVLIEEIGQFGPYQLKTVFFLLIIIICDSWSASEYMFTTARINTRCFIPECEDVTKAPEFKPSWIMHAIPTTDIHSFEQCQRFAGKSLANISDTCPPELFDHDNVEYCKKYVFENKNSIVYDFGLACDEWRRSIVGTIKMCGLLIGLPLAGFVSDRWGRRCTVILSVFAISLLGFARYWANSYEYFITFAFLESAFGTGSYSSAYILSIELVGPKYRLAVGTTVNCFFAVGKLLLGPLAWAVPNWRRLILAIYLPQMFCISYFWIISESVRWQVSKGRFKQCETILKEVARVNKKSLSEKTLILLQRNIEKETNQKKQKNEVDEPWLIVEVFRHKNVLIRCILSPIWWITATLVYYGLTINAVNMTGNQYFNFVAVSAIEVPAYWTSFALIEKVGRKPVLIAAYWVCAACQIGYILMPDGQYIISLVLYLISKYSIAMVMTGIYIYTSELYPTKYRHRLFAYSSTLGRFGSIVAPLTPSLGIMIWKPLPFAIFASFAFLSGCLVFFTPETIGCKLSDTMEEAENIGKKNNKT